MPEIPDLEAIRAFFNERLAGREIVRAEVVIPTVVRTGSADFVATMTGNRWGETLRQGKFLLTGLADERVLVLNAMLTGRFQYVEPKAKKRARTCFVLAFDNGMELRYSDQMVMGKVYVVPPDGVMSVPTFAEMGPDALAVSEEEFRSRIKKHSGQIKNVLTNHKFVAGIGNAYSDEILFEGRIDPFRKRNALSDEEIGRLYRGMRKTYERSIPILREHFREDLDYEEWREHLKVHRKGAKPGADRDEGRCPRCGLHISEIAPNQRVTSWCRNCQR
jgi:formamidopyrimidine-DNA glycosylase